MNTENLLRSNMFNFIMENKKKISTPKLWKDSTFSDTSSGYFSAVDQAEFEDLDFKTAPKNIQSDPFMAGSSQDVLPIYTQNNLLVQQSNSGTQKPRCFNSSARSVSRSPVVLVQPFVPSSYSSASAPSTSEARSTKCSSVLNSFLKISPSHRRKGHRKSGLSHKHRGKQRERHHDNGCTVLKCDPIMAVNSSINLGEVNVDFKNTSAKLKGLLEPSATTTPFSLYNDVRSPIFLQSTKDEDFTETLSPSLSKQKRFCNTYNILNQSGLLGITMRTKELIRQNKHAQAQLQKLQAHTDLFLEAINSRDPQILAKLQRTLQNTTEESTEDLFKDTVSCM